MQKVEFGNGKISLLREIILKEKPKKILILRGQKSYSYFSDKIDSLINSDFTSFVVTESNLSFDLLNRGIKHYNEQKCDLIISIGGGSVIDMGKLISIFSANESNPHSYITGKRQLVKKNNKLISIPTTSGSGSEATHFAVIYDSITKYSVVHESLLPDYSIIDPELTYSLTNYQTAISGMDALCQGIESFWSLGSTYESKKYSKEAIELVMNNLEKAVLSPDSQSRYNMALGSHLAGKAINLAKTTAAHAFSYPLTQLFGIPHGHAVSLTIGKFYEYNFKKLSKENSKNTILELNKILGVNDGREARIILEALISKIGLSLNLPDEVIFEDEVSRIVSNVNLERLSNNPAEVRKKDLENIFASICT